MLFTPKNKAVLPGDRISQACALATYRVDGKRHQLDIFEEIALGQSIGAWDERFVEVSMLQNCVAKIVSCCEVEDGYQGTIAFPWELWHGELSWLLTLVFGKLSFYPGIRLTELAFEEHCFSSSKLKGPQHSLPTLRQRIGAPPNMPLLMGILKPNVAMSPSALADIYAEVAHAGVNLVKDDEIRHDCDLATTLRRIEKVANRKARENLKTLYVVHAPIDASAQASLKDWSEKLKSAGADALLVNVWTAGLGTLQELRQATDLPLMAHPALAGALGQGNSNDSIDPAVLLGSFMRAAGADFTLFPSPYGKIGLPKTTTQRISDLCRMDWPAQIRASIPVPSAGIKPEHVTSAYRDFGRDFVLNAGTSIFATGQSVNASVRLFLNELETCGRAQ